MAVLTLREAIEKARPKIAALHPARSHPGLDIDTRAALLNLDAALERAIGHATDGVIPAGDEIDVDLHVAALARTKKSEDIGTQQAIREIIRLFQRTISHNRPH